MIQWIMEEDDVDEIEGMLNSVSVLNQVTHEDMAEERFYPWTSLSICYSWRESKNIGHL